MSEGTRVRVRVGGRDIEGYVKNEIGRERESQMGSGERGGGELGRISSVKNNFKVCLMYLHKQTIKLQKLPEAPVFKQNCSQTETGRNQYPSV